MIVAFLIILVCVAVFAVAKRIDDWERDKNTLDEWDVWREENPPS